MMKFIISRTSNYNREVSPCDGCKQELVPNYDRRTFKSPEQHDRLLREAWLSRGTEHTVTERGIQRRLDDVSVWTKEFSSLDELTAFLFSYSEVVVIAECYLSNGMPEIEIYDCYRE